MLISYMIHISVIFMLMFSTFTLYRITYVLLASLVLLALSQVLAAITDRMSQPKPKME